MNNTTKKVSILIPAYNTEKYIAKCLDSVVNQTYQNIEIIVLNDGSTDRTLEIAKNYSKKYSNIHLISQQNKGISITRNRLIEYAYGDYIIFVDSDDYIDHNMVEGMVCELEKRDLDVIQCGYNMELLNNTLSFTKQQVITKDYSTIDAIHHLAEEKNLNNYLWGKVFKKELFNNTLFENNLSHFEDLCIIYKLFANANKIGTTNNNYYHYLIRQGSVTNKMTVEEVNNMHKAYEMQEQGIRKLYPDEHFDFSKQHYNTDMVMLYILLFSTQNSTFQPYNNINWQNLPIPVLWKIAYKTMQGINNIKSMLTL